METEEGSIVEKSPEGAHAKVSSREGYEANEAVPTETPGGARISGGDVVVSVVCTAHNHAPYIGKALDGFLLQETQFPIEIIVHDDASTDATADIIRDYAARNPGRLKCVLQTENQYARRGNSLLHDVVIPLTSGEFIAVCEGDDYWTDPQKLAKQVEFMRQWPRVSMCFHAARVEDAQGLRPPTVHRYRGGPILDSRTVVLNGGGLYPTCSALFRREVLKDYPRFLMAAPVADSMWALNAITKGAVGYIDEVMAVYNRGVPGSQTQEARQRTLSENLEYIGRLEAVRSTFDEYTGFKYTRWIRRRASRSRMLALVRGAREDGSFRRYADLRSGMLLRDRLLFLIGFLYFRLGKSRESSGHARPSAARQVFRGTDVRQNEKG